MKVLLATDCYIFQTGGVTNVVLSLENGLRAKGHDVRVLALSNSHRSYRDGDSYFIRSFRFYDYPEHRRSLARHDPLLDALKEWKPDIVHIHTEASAGRMARAIARETHAPVVMTTHTYFEYFIFGRFRGFPWCGSWLSPGGRRPTGRRKRSSCPRKRRGPFPICAPWQTA